MPAYRSLITSSGNGSALGVEAFNGGARNRILSLLPDCDLERLRPHLFEGELREGPRLYEAGEAIEQVYFPHTAVISLVVTLRGGPPLEVAMIGHEGVLGAGAAEVPFALSDATVRVAGTASRVPASVLYEVAAESDVLRALILRSEAAILVQARQAAACNALHSAEARVCRWILEIQDRVDSDRFDLKQETLAAMLGLQRTTVTLVAGKLQGSGLITCRRGRISVLDRRGLEHSACECYREIKRLCEPLLPSSRAAKLRRSEHLRAGTTIPQRSLPPFSPGNDDVGTERQQRR